MRALRSIGIAVATATALAAFPALASGQVEVLSEEAGFNTHCDMIAECAVEVHGETQEAYNVHLITGAEVVASTCQAEWTLTPDEDGEGFITNQVLSGGNCVHRPCGATSQGSGNGDPWPAHLREASGELSLHYIFCLVNADDSGRALNCEISLHVDDISGHFYEFTAVDERCAAPTLPPGYTSVEVDGHWITESDAIEVVH